MFGTVRNVVLIAAVSVFSLLPGLATAQNLLSCLNTRHQNAIGLVTYNFWRDGEVDGGQKNGTGFVITPDGHMITANHVVSASGTIRNDEVEVRLRSRLAAPIKAQVLLRLPQSDLALLLLKDKHDIDFVPVASEKELDVGEMLVAFGFPGSASLTPSGPAPVSSTLTLVDGAARSSIQANLELSGGNSGGPVFDELGTVVGVAVEISTEVSSLSFIEPIDELSAVLAELAVPRLLYDSTCAEFPTCRAPQHGVEGYQVDLIAERWGAWRGGGYNQSAHCNDVLDEVSARYPGAELFETKRTEEARWTGALNRTREYRYYCAYRVTMEPVFLEDRSPACLGK